MGLLLLINSFPFQSLHHPSIVRLYETIETDKYIGIILDYASGGELFDHILAHRYLKERDARKLFAQLISAVWYIHQKKIVHRDLKLENLLLDRNRNIIVTDFGFANRFEHKSDDLMQTSCGSPCYAAPELVISEGMYVGSAVDIWSCGVILYAMLAGYLPFDDDPENPEGDNIQQLYRYILNTPLTFPDHVSAEARDLLQKMLVPEPAHRATLQTVMDHPWLQPYAHLFTHSVEESERQSKEIQDAKKHQYRKQMREREKEQIRQARAQAQRREHHQTHHIEPSTSSRDGRSPFDNALLQGSGGYPQAERSGRRAVASAIVLPSSPPDDDHPLGMTADGPYSDPFASVTGVAHGTSVPGDPGSSQPPRDRKASTKSHGSKKGSSGRQHTPTETTSPTSAAITSVAVPVQKAKKAGGYRHTIQLEYDDGGEVEPAPPTPPRPSSRSQRAAAEQQRLEQGISNLNLDTHAVPLDSGSYFNPATMSEPIKPQSPTKTQRRPSNAQRPHVPIPAVPAIPPSSFSPTGRRGSNASPVLQRNPATDPGQGYDGSYDSNEPQLSASVSAAVTPLSPPLGQEPGIMCSPPATSDAMRKRDSQDKSRPTSSSGRRHARGISLDRIAGFGKLITGMGKDSNVAINTNAAGDPVSSPTVNKRASGVGKRSSSRTGRKGGETIAPATPQEAPMDSTTSIVTPTATGEGSSTAGDAPFTPTTPGGSTTNTQADSSMSESNSGSVKGSKRRANKALSLMVDPIIKIKEHRSKNRASITVGAEDSSKDERSDRKTKGQSTPLSAHPEKSTPFVSKYEGPSSTLIEKPHQLAQTAPGWRLPLFRDTSVRGQSRTQAPPVAQQLPTPVVLPIVSPAPEDIDPYNSNAPMTGMAPSGATTKSQGVMDWFRKKSLAKERRRAGSTTEMPSTIPVAYPDTTGMEIGREAAMERDAAGDRTKTPTPMDVQEEAKTPTRSSFKKGREGKNTPSVIITQPHEPFSSGGSRHESFNSSSTTPSRMDRVVGAIKNVTHTPPAVTMPTHTKRSAGASSGGSLGGSSSGGASYNKVVLRLHDGPVDPSTVSSAPPQEVIIQVLEVLKALGIQYTKESEFKYRCVRPKKKKPNAVGKEPSGSGGVAAGPSTSNGVS